MKTFNLIAKTGREFSINNGWTFNEETTTSKDFETKEAALEGVEDFKKELNIDNTEYWEIELMISEDGEPMDFESVVSIDNSPVRQYIVYRYFGQYMIGKDKYRVDYNTHKLTNAELFTRPENKSFNFSEVEAFDTEEEVRNFFKDLEYATIENSVVKNIFEEIEEE